MRSVKSQFLLYCGKFHEKARMFLLIHVNWVFLYSLLLWVLAELWNSCSLARKKNGGEEFRECQLHLSDDPSGFLQLVNYDWTKPKIPICINWVYGYSINIRLKVHNSNGDQKLRKCFFQNFLEVWGEKDYSPGRFFLLKLPGNTIIPVFQQVVPISIPKVKSI